jgi:hypothetical protein
MTRMSARLTYCSSSGPTDSSLTGRAGAVHGRPPTVRAPRVCGHPRHRTPTVVEVGQSNRVPYEGQLPTSLLHGAGEEIDALADMDQDGGIEYLFPTPILWHVFRNVEHLNAELRDLILKQEPATPSMAKSNQGGWQSATDFFSWDGSAVATLRRFASRAVEVAAARLGIPRNARCESHLSGWAAVNRKCHYNSAHVRPRAAWSGVYYVDPGDDAPDDGLGGVLELAHPSVASVMMFFPGLLLSAGWCAPRPA